MGKRRKFQKESEFHDFIHKELNKIGVFFKKEAASIRGLPDEIGCLNGVFVAFEVKRNKSEAQKKTGRIVLQNHRLKKFRDHKGFALLVYPENWNEVYQELCSRCDVTPLQCSLL